MLIVRKKKADENWPAASRIKIQKLMQQTLREECVEKISVYCEILTQVWCCANFSIGHDGIYDVVDVCSVHSAEH